MNAPYTLPENQDPVNSKYVILRGIEEGNKFITTNHHEYNEFVVQHGKQRRAFEVLGYANTIAEAQIFLYGKDFTTKEKIPLASH